MISAQATKFNLELGQLKFNKVWYKKGSTKKRKTRKNRSMVFETALEGGREWIFSLGELRLFNAFVILKATFSRL